jgi:hypothetical protein
MEAVHMEGTRRHSYHLSQGEKNDRHRYGAGDGPEIQVWTNPTGRLDPRGGVNSSPCCGTAADDAHHHPHLRWCGLAARMIVMDAARRRRWPTDALLADTALLAAHGYVGEIFSTN